MPRDMSGPALLAAERVIRRPPEKLGAGEAALFAHEHEKTFGEVRGERLSGVQVLQNGFLIRTLRPLPQSFILPPTCLRWTKIAARTAQHLVAASRVTSVEQGLFVTDEFSNGFFHWICDVLPRLEMLAKSSPESLEGRTLLVPAMADFSYVRPSLEAYRLGGLKILGRRERVRCADLLVVPPVAPTGNYRPDLMHALRERFRKYFAVGVSSRRIFISRAKAPKRRIANEAEILPVLQRHGFECVAPEFLPFAEQLRLLGSASILAGNHGAGLTNMAWMAPGSRVLELRRKNDRENNCYYSLASALDIPYYFLQCGIVNERESTITADFVVDPDAFDMILTSMDD